jgi:hypothetical protein
MTGEVCAVISDAPGAFDVWIPFFMEIPDARQLRVTVTVYFTFTAAELAARGPAPLAALSRACGVRKGGRAGA